MKRLVGIILFFSFGCQYHPDEINFINIDKPTFSDASIFLNTADDILIYKPTNLKFILSGESLNPIEVKAKIDSVEVANFSFNFFDTLTIRIDPEDFTNSIHELKIEILTKPNNNSLGDTFGYELYQIWSTWQIDIDITPPLPIQIDTIYVLDNAIKIEWAPPKKLNFDFYDFGPYGCLDKIDKYSTNLVYSFLSGERVYKINTTSPYFTVYGLEKNFSYYDNYEKVTIVDSNKVQFSWRPPILNRGSEKLFISDNFRYNYEKNALSVDSLILENDLLFGQFVNFRTSRTINSFPNTSCYDYYENRYSVFIGDTISAFDEIVFDPNQTKYYTKYTNLSYPRNTTLKRYSKDFELEEEILLNYDGSNHSLNINPNGDLLAFFTSNLELILIQTEPLKVKTVNSIDVTLNSGYSSRSLVKFTTNDKILIKTLGRGFLFNLNSKKIEFNQPGSFIAENIDISEDGNTLFYNTGIYNYVMDTFQLSYNIPATKGLFLIDNKFLGTDNVELFLFDLETKSKVSSLQITLGDLYYVTKSDGIFAYRIYTDLDKHLMILASSDGRIQLNDLYSGDSLKTLRSSNDGRSFYDNGYFLHTSGNILKYF